MAKSIVTILCLLLFPWCCTLLYAEEKGTKDAEEGTIVTFWPLIDYRESPRDGFRNLSLLGPLVKFQQWGDESESAVRPLFFRTSNPRKESSETTILYPLASVETSPEVSTFQVAKLFQKNIYRKDDKENQGESNMFFPFYLSGTSKKYGPYTSVFPIHGDIYERFWRDEIHFTLFPLYSRTVKKGTTTRNYLYPFFATIEGERESGFHFWPLYGESAKEGSYRKRFVLWPLFLQEKSGLDGDTPTDTLYLFPFYAATDSPKSTSRYVLWPFFGYKTEKEGNQVEHDYFWPLWRTVRGDNRTLTSWVPFYLEEERKEYRKRWIMWPVYKHEEITADNFREERDRLLYFLYSDNREFWPKDGTERRRTAVWPLFVATRDPRGVKSLSVPAPVEPILDKEGIEKSWAPLWRLYQQKWDDNGDSAVSVLWNLYWHEVRGEAIAFEFFPLIAGRSGESSADYQFLKGLLRYRKRGGEKSVSFFWLPFGVHWKDDSRGERGQTDTVTGNLP